MTKSKSTKKALTTSIFALVVCFAMLVGSTFAWFTDSASTAVNTIKSGNLKLELQDQAGKSVEDRELKFQKATGHEEEPVLWEPGCTYDLEPVTIVNKGNLALKYKIAIAGISGDTGLNKVIDWTITVGGETVTDLDEFEGYLLANGDANDRATLKISGTMQTTAGNEYQDQSIEGASITVVATQYTYEYDSFSSGYDENAGYPVSAANFADTLEKGGNLALTEDVTMSDSGTVVNMADGTVLDLSDKTVSTEYMGLIAQGNDITIKNGNVSAFDGVSYGLFVGDMGETNNAVIENVVIQGGINAFNASNVVLRDCEIHGRDYYAVWADVNAEIIIESGTYYGGTNNGTKMPALNAFVSANPEEDGPSGIITVKGGSFDTDPSAYVDLTQYDVTETDGMFVVTAK